MRLMVRWELLVFGLAAACGPFPSNGDGGVTGQGQCSKAHVVAQASADHSTPATAQVIDSGGGGIVLLPASGTSLTGFFKVTGYAPSQNVKAQLVKAPCSTFGCPGTFDLSFSGPQGDDLFSSGGSCGSGTFAANASGELTPSVAGGSTDGIDVGLWLTPL
jgi:hypothetical protein